MLETAFTLCNMAVSLLDLILVVDRKPLTCTVNPRCKAIQATPNSTSSSSPTRIGSKSCPTKKRVVSARRRVIKFEIKSSSRHLAPPTTTGRRKETTRTSLVCRLDPAPSISLSTILSRRGPKFRRPSLLETIPEEESVCGGKARLQGFEEDLLGQICLQDGSRSRG